MFGLAAFTAFGGLVALLAGLYGLHRTRRVKHAGLPAFALVKPALPGSDRPMLEFETADGHVLEVVSPTLPGQRMGLIPGAEIRIAYDVDDPREIVLIGRERVRLDQAFMVAGAALGLFGLLLVSAAW